MPSPFPGMDLYIEDPAIWPDFHGNMISAMRAALNARLPKRYVAVTEIHVWINEPERDSTPRLGRPDGVIVDQIEDSSIGPTTSVLEALTLITLPLLRESGSRFLQIIESGNHRVISVIELLSPAVKVSGRDRESYLAKRNDYLAGGINLVEIDLLRGALGFLWEQSRCRSWITTRWSVGQRNCRGQVCGGSRLSEPLPEIPIPLDPGESELLLPLRECMDRVYDEGRYQQRLRYHRPLQPRLTVTEEAWAQNIFAQATMINRPE